MGFHVNESQFDAWLTEQQKTYDIYAPKRYAGGNTFSDVDCIRYGKVRSISEIVFDRKSEYSFKEVLTPISQTLFFFTESISKEADPPKKGAIIFLRSCDLHALKRLDDIAEHHRGASDQPEGGKRGLSRRRHPEYHRLHRQPGLPLRLL